jgi:hypothetical protein
VLPPSYRAHVVFREKKIEASGEVTDLIRRRGECPRYVSRAGWI